MTNDFVKTVRIGTGENGNIFCKIKFIDGKLSITGVEGPFPNGNAKGGCGQINMHDWNISKYAPDWNSETVAKFRTIWDKWHLNDMRPNCEHQIGPDWEAKEIEVITYGITSEGFKLRKEALTECERAGMAGEVANLSATGKALLTDVWFKDMHSAPDANSPLYGLFEVKKRENKQTNWVSQEEHPSGFFSKPCPVCGYKYGNKWLREDVPADVLEFLRGLPPTDITPAWV